MDEKGHSHIGQELSADSSMFCLESVNTQTIRSTTTELVFVDVCKLGMATVVRQEPFLSGHAQKHPQPS